MADFMDDSGEKKAVHMIEVSKIGQMPPQHMVDAGTRQSNRLVEDCFVGLSSLLHNQYVQVDGKQYQMQVLTHEGKILFDIKGLPGFDHVEFCIGKTGWGRGV